MGVIQHYPYFNVRGGVIHRMNCVCAKDNGCTAIGRTQYIEKHKES